MLTGHGHSHSGPLDIAPGARRRVSAILAAVVLPLAIATAVLLVALWPKGETPVGSRPLYSNGAQAVTGEVTSVGKVDSSGQTPVKMKVDGVDVPVHVPPEIIANGLDVGDEIRAIFNPAALESGTAYVFTDFVRTPQMLWLLAVYVAVVLAVARWKGAMALAGLGVSLAVVGAFMVPALTVSEHPVLVILVGAAAMMFASIYLAHGISIRTTTAVIGTFAGLVITTGVAWWAVGAANLTGALSDDARILAGELPNVQLQAILLGGVILAGLGALNDVTITQVSTVWELHTANPRLTRRRLVSQGMAVGRDHIASTVYTLAFAYVGTALTLLVAAALMQRSAADLVQLGEIAEEIVRTLAASIGLVLAIPLTTAVAAVLAPVAPTAARSADDDPEGDSGDGDAEETADAQEAWNDADGIWDEDEEGWDGEPAGGRKAGSPYARDRREEFEYDGAEIDRATRGDGPWPR